MRARARCTASGASRPASDRAEDLSLVGKLGGGVEAAAEHVTDLEERHAVVAVRPVVGHRPDQPGQQRGAQHGLLGDERVGDGDAVVGQTAAAQLARGEERERHGLGQAAPHEHPAQGPPLELARGEPARRGRPSGRCGPGRRSHGGGPPPRSRRSRWPSRSATKGSRRRGRRPAGVVVKPIGSRSSAMRSAPRSVPSRPATRAVRSRTGGRSGSTAVDRDPARLEPRRRRGRAAARTGAWPGRSPRGRCPSRTGRTPRSAACGAGTTSRCRCGWNHAISSRTSVVVASISLRAPPMMPGQAGGHVVGVADEEVGGASGGARPRRGSRASRRRGPGAPGSPGPATLARS